MNFSNFVEFANNYSPFRRVSNIFNNDCTFLFKGGLSAIDEGFGLTYNKLKSHNNKSKGEFTWTIDGGKELRICFLSICHSY